jgi:DNA-binding protein YbaB
VSDFVSAAAAAEATQIAASLWERSARLTAAATAAGAVSCEASSGRGRPSEVSVTAAGTGRVSKIYVGPQAMHSGPAGLADTLSRLVNEAVSGAKQRAAKAIQEALTEAGEPSLATALQEAVSSPDAATARFAAELAAQTVSASSPGRKVTATASGTGEITRIEFGSTALRGDDNVSLAAEIAAAVNGAFEAAGRLQQPPTGAPSAGSAPAAEADLAEVLDAQVSVFNRQMDELSHRLDEVTKSLPDLS